MPGRGVFQALLCCLRALGMSDAPQLRRSRTQIPSPTKEEYEHPRRFLTRGEGAESWKLGEPPSPTLWRQICQSRAFSNCDECTSGRGDMKFSSIAHRRVLGETSPSRSTLEVVGTGGVAGKGAKCPIRTAGRGGGHQQRKCGKEHLF